MTQIKKITHVFGDLTAFERSLWLGSIAVILASGILFEGSDPLSLLASLIGATALIFVAKGYVLGQVLTIVFALFYGVISYEFRYYGEMITYLGMTAPIAGLAVISWLRHPFEGTKQVAAAYMDKKEIAVMAALAVGTTAAFYYILRALGNANLIFSTLSVTTSFLASYMTWRRCPYYALGYAANDIILIILWVAAAMESSGCIPMIACFSIFLLNDLYGFVSWQKMYKAQRNHLQFPAE